MVLFLRNLFFGVLSAVLTACGVGARAQESQLRAPLAPLQAVAGPQSRLEDELRQLSGQAGVIFAGQVLAVRQQGGTGMGSGWVEVEFHVEEAVRGCVGQGTYRLREWAGLWAGGLERYRVGERLLMLLHAPGPSGLSSPVGGQDGAIPIAGSGDAPGPQDVFVGSGEQAVDLRWVQARLLRASRLPGSAEAPVGRGRTAASQEPGTGRERALLTIRGGTPPRLRGGLRFESGRLGGGPVRGPIEFAGEVNPPSPDGGGMARGISLRSVMAMLGAWEAQQTDAAR